MAVFPGPPGWASARRELLEFKAQEKINRGRHTDHPAGRHSIRTNQCPPPPSPHIFYRLDALPAAQPTVSKHWRHVVIATKPKSTQHCTTRGTPTIPQSYIWVLAVVWSCGEGQTERHRRAWPMYISPWLRLMRHVINSFNVSVWLTVQ